MQFATTWMVLDIDIVKLLSCVWLLATLWTVAYQAPLYMDFTGKSTGVGCHFLPQGIFLTQGSNLGLPHYMQIHGPRDYHFKQNRKTNITCYHLYVESKTQYTLTFVWTRNKLTYVENRLVVVKGEGGGI